MRQKSRGSSEGSASTLFRVDALSYFDPVDIFPHGLGPTRRDAQQLRHRRAPKPDAAARPMEQARLNLQCLMFSTRAHSPSHSACAKSSHWRLKTLDLNCPISHVAC